MKKEIVVSINNFVCGGAQKQLVRLLPHLIDDYKIHLVLLFKYPESETILNELPDEVVVHQIDFKGFASLSEWNKYFKLLKEIKPELIVSSFFFSNVVARVLGKILKVPVLAREHNTTAGKGWMQRMADRYLAIGKMPILGVSAEVADTVSKEVGIRREKFIVINNGIDLSEIDSFSYSSPSLVKEELGINKNGKVAVAVGRLVKQKRFDLMIESFALFAKDNSDWTLVIVGGGWQMDELQEMTKKLGISNQVKFTGEVSNTHKYYAIADCLISTSKMEGLSNVHLEALSHGVPIVTTPTGGTSVVVLPEETGLIIEEETSEAIAAALKKFTTMSAESMRAASLRHRENFAIERTAEEYSKLFSKLCAE